MARDNYMIDEEEFRPEGPEGSGSFTGGEDNAAPMEKLGPSPFTDNVADNLGSNDTVVTTLGTGYSPRENFPQSEGLPGSDGNIRTTPAVSSVPRPAQNAVSTNRGEGEYTGGGAGVPVRPVPSIGPIGAPGSAGSRLFGFLGGLKGGGLGTPRAVYNPNDPGQTSIAQLMALLQQRRRSLF